MAAITIPAEFGYVIGVGFLSNFLNLYLGGQVGGARSRAGIPYPYLYADMAAAEEDPKKKLFNCYQRAHQNFLEGYASFLVVLFSGGIRHPIASAVAGVIFLAGRLAYAQGYQTGDPSKRGRGSFGYIGLLTLWGTTVSSIVSLVLSTQV